MSMIPRISILMPVFNGKAFINEAIESVKSQNFRNWELLVSDNCSSDGTQEYLATIVDGRIKIFKQKINLGIFGNLNFLMGQARAPIAKILCADDLLLPGAIERIALFMEERPNCVLSRCWSEGETGRFSHGSRASFEGSLPSSLIPTASVLAFATFGNIVGNLSKAAIRPKPIIEAGGFDQSFPYAGDYEGWIRISALFGIELQNEELIFERVHVQQNSVLLNRKNELDPQINKIIEGLSDFFSAQELLVLKRHWVIHFLSPRLSRAAKQFLSGNFRLCFSSLRNLPMEISALSVIAAYPIWKLNLATARKTTQWLYLRIEEINSE